MEFWSKWQRRICQESTRRPFWFRAFNLPSYWQKEIWSVHVSSQPPTIGQCLEVCIISLILKAFKKKEKKKKHRCRITRPRQHSCKTGRKPQRTCMRLSTFWIRSSIKVISLLQKRGVLAGSSARNDLQPSYHRSLLRDQKHGSVRRPLPLPPPAASGMLQVISLIIYFHGFKW